MKKQIDLKGQVFGKWLVSEFAGASKWKCICECGNTGLIRTFDLINNKSRSCGCYKSELLTKDLSGEIFNKLTVIGKDFTNNRNDKYLGIKWFCKCECGNIKSIRSNDLVNGKYKSCGCYKIKGAAESHRKNYLTNSPEYRAWTKLKTRCLNPKDKNFHNYGGRGVSVCQRWLDSFENFLEDMGERPSPKHSIDRFPDNSDNSVYEKCNCRWATKKEQNYNRRSCVWLEYNGEKRILKDWAKIFGCSSSALKWTIKSKKSFSEAYIHYTNKNVMLQQKHISQK